MKLPFDIKKHSQAILFMGIQASGKSTFFKELLLPHDYTHINLDTLHTRHKEQKLLSECLQADKSFVVDNTNPEKADRQRYIPKAKERGYEVIGIFFQSIVKDCIRRNEERGNTVPLTAIPRTSNRLQLPSYDEGFDAIYFVRIGEEGFEISEWRE